uniref:peroxidase n=1 Tax=Nicotiana tabacum TaxID=4097 RepID=A0A1S4BTJ4_TOBAC|nr:PREDICTED: peroxidase 49-like [Nicotiana tabacum]
MIKDEIEEACSGVVSCSDILVLATRDGVVLGLSAFSSIGASFDNHYYKTLIRGRGLLFADQKLMANEKTAEVVIDYALDDGTMFRTEFAHAMAKLLDFVVLTGSQGEVQRSCSHLNSKPVRATDRNIYVQYGIDQLHLLLLC